MPRDCRTLEQAITAWHSEFTSGVVAAFALDPDAVLADVVEGSADEPPDGGAVDAGVPELVGTDVPHGVEPELPCDGFESGIGGCVVVLPVADDGFDKDALRPLICRVSV